MDIDKVWIKMYVETVLVKFNSNDNSLAQPVSTRIKGIAIFPRKSHFLSRSSSKTKTSRTEWMSLTTL